MDTVTIRYGNDLSIIAEVNGSSFITDNDPDMPDFFPEVEIEYADYTVTLHNAQLVECAAIDNRYWFALVEMPQQELLISRLQATVDYIAMMTDIEL